MKRALLYATMFVMFACSSAYAEATFDQIQGLIKSHDYAAAVQGLNVIIQNHPRSAKAYYAMSQAQAGIGNQAKAKEALDMARGLDPSLKFAPSGSVEHLQEAIQPQTKKIEAIESHTLRNCLIAFALIGAAVFFYMRRKGRGEPKKGHKPELPHSPTPQAYQNAHNAASSSLAMSSGNPALRARPVYTPPRPSYTPPPVQHTTVVHNNGGSDLVTGMMLGSMMHGSHDHERTVIEREYIPVRKIEAPRETPSRSSSWDDSDSKSSSWDSGSSSSSSSWDDSSSSSSSSWDSGSSSDSSSSSWD